MIIGIQQPRFGPDGQPAQGKAAHQHPCRRQRREHPADPADPTTLEYALEFINDDELVEVTPRSIRVRKKLLKEHERKKASRAA
jgi:GTP-binding protein